jgi:hypothetical protein
LLYSYAVFISPIDDCERDPTGEMI